jgi:SecD/SecF fusion protein
MKSTLKTLFIIPVLFIASCFNANQGGDYKIVLDISIRSYIGSLTHGEITLPEAPKNGVASAATNEEIVDDFIGTFSRLQSDKWLLDIFSKNEMLPKFENTIALKHFIVSDYNARINRMHEVILNRISNFTGTPKDKIKIKQTKSQIIVLVSGIEDKKRLEAAFENRGGINFWEVAQLAEIFDYVTRLNDTIISLAPKKSIRPIDTSKELSLQDAIARGNMEEKTNDDLFKVLQPAIGPTGKPYGTAFWAIASVKDTAKVNAYLASPAYKAIFPENMKMLWGNVPEKHDNPSKALVLYAIKTGFEGRPLVDADDVKSAKFDYINGQTEIAIEMNARGAVKWANATQKCVGKPIAIEMSNFVLSAPNVLSKITGGRSSVTGDFSAEEGDKLARSISSGSFPLDFKIVSIEKYTDKESD